MTRPQVLSCGHSFCFTCVFTWFKHAKARRKCPICRTRITRRPVYNVSLGSIIQILGGKVTSEIDTGSEKGLWKQIFGDFELAAGVVPDLEDQVR
jgi:hypothetical protein